MEIHLGVGNGSEGIYIQVWAMASQGGKIIGLYNVIVHRHGYLWLSIGIIIVSSCLLPSSSPNVALLPGNDMILKWMK